MNKKTVVIILSILVVAGGCFGRSDKTSKDRKGEKRVSEEKKEKVAEISEKWEEQKVVIPGRYADADAVKLDDGPSASSGRARLRIYYSLEPEAPGFEGQAYSAISSDGLNWMQEEGVRMKWAAFPSVIKLPDGRWRMYFQGSKEGSPSESGIMSAISQDGLNWTKEDGFRIKKGQQGKYDTENVAAPTVVELSGSTYLMVYRGSAGENRFGKMDPFTGKHVPIDYLISATSSDGLNWTPQSMVVDSRNEELHDQIDGPELAIDGDSIKLYCNSYGGVYLLSLSKNGKAKTPSKMVIKADGPDHAPNDVTLVKVDNEWRMYFGIHTKGIFSAKRVE